jgi:hypothetical protein
LQHDIVQTGSTLLIIATTSSAGEVKGRALDIEQ